MSHLPITPPEGVGVIYPSCDDRSSRIVLPIRAGIGFRVTCEAALCFDCGPDGSVYHPDSATFDELQERWPHVAMLQDPTDVDLAAFDAEMRERFGHDDTKPEARR